MIATTLSNARQSGYDAFWDGYSIFCMDGVLPEAQAFQFRKGYEEARKEGRGR